MRVPNESCSMIDYVKAWQCIGCGKIEAPQTCVGICQDQKIELVYAHDHRAAMAQMQLNLQAAESLLRRIALATPRHDQWEASYRNIQLRARQLLAKGSSQAPVPQSAQAAACASSAGTVPNSR